MCYTYVFDYVKYVWNFTAYQEAKGHLFLSVQTSQFVVDAFKNLEKKKHMQMAHQKFSTRKSLL